jgi:hypothetical protein
MLEKNDFAVMKSNNEQLVSEVESLKQKLSEDVKRTQAGVRLDLNLEKGRIRDESSAIELKIQETDTRLEGEISNLRTQMESIKFQLLQYMIGRCKSFMPFLFSNALLKSYPFNLFLFLHLSGTLTGAGALILGKSFVNLLFVGYILELTNLVGIYIYSVHAHVPIVSNCERTVMESNYESKILFCKYTIYTRERERGVCVCVWREEEGAFI